VSSPDTTNKLLTKPELFSTLLLNRLPDLLIVNTASQLCQILFPDQPTDGEVIPGPGSEVAAQCHKVKGITDLHPAIELSFIVDATIGTIDGSPLNTLVIPGPLHPRQLVRIHVPDEYLIGGVAYNTFIVANVALGLLQELRRSVVRLFLGECCAVMDHDCRRMG